MYWHSISQVPRGSVTFKKWLPPIFTPYLWSKIKSQVYLGITKTWLINLCTCGCSWSVFDTFDMFEIHLGEWHMFFFVALQEARNQHCLQLHQGLSLTFFTQISIGFDLWFEHTLLIHHTLLEVVVWGASGTNISHLTGLKNNDCVLQHCLTIDLDCKQHYH